MNGRNWAFPERPLRRPKAAGRLPLTVVAFEAAERRHLVESGTSALREAGGDSRNRVTVVSSKKIIFRETWQLIQTCFDNACENAGDNHERQDANLTGLLRPSP